MGKLGNFLKFLISNFGPILVFYGANHFYGIRVAVIASIVFAVAEVVYKRSRREKLSGFFIFSFALTLVFGAVDYFFNSPVLFKYEAAVTSVIMGIYFGMSLFGPKTIVQQFAEQRDPKRVFTKLARANCRYLTIMWTVYFFAKAAAYVWVGANYSLEEGLAIRTLGGNATFYALMGFSFFLSKPFFERLRKLKILPS